MKGALLVIGSVIILLTGTVWWSNSQVNDPTLVSASGIHWHPVLTIFVNGVKQEIPANIGIGPEHASAPTYDPAMKMTEIHTHDDANAGIIHMEFSGKVTKDDTKLGNFFQIWGKDFNSFGQNVTMTVNGVENTDFANYLMKDKEKIELRYE